MTPRILSASSINGTDVRNPHDENLGEIKDLMIDTSEGKVSYAVLSFGGFLGMGDKYFAIPLDSLDFSNHDTHEFAVLDIPKERLKEAPGFDKDHWPQTFDDSYFTKVNTYYTGSRPGGMHDSMSEGSTGSGMAGSNRNSGSVL